MKIVSVIFKWVLNSYYDRGNELEEVFLCRKVASVSL